jgi:hypothetical protein
MARDPELLAGLAWGRPRRGHPEGAVGRHVADLLARIEPHERRRGDLRFIAIVHDAAKRRAHDPGAPPSENDHALLARRLAERWVRDEAVLSTVELHDECWWLWHRRDAGVAARLDAIAARIRDPALYLRFVELDQTAPGKDPRPLPWFRAEFERRRPLSGGGGA